MGRTSELHKLLNRERTKRGLTYARWNQELWHGCKGQSNRMLRSKHLFHAQAGEIPSGGECVCGGKGRHSPKTIAKSWMSSPRHEVLILGPYVRSHAVAISGDKHGTYATWRGSYETAHTSPKPRRRQDLYRRLWIMISRLFTG